MKLTKIKNTRRLLFSLFLAFLAPTIFATDLIDVFKQAAVSDATFRKAEADWLTARQQLPLAIVGNGVAGSGLLPNLDLNALKGKQYTTTESTGSPPRFFSGPTQGYGLNLTQPIFNYQTWKAISQARFSVKAATATYFAAEQDLMARTAQAYFNVLNASDVLEYTTVEKEALLRQLVTQKQKYQVGLIAVTDVYNAQASYDQTVAEEIAARNALRIALENLRAITGIRYVQLATLHSTIPLVVPCPQDIEKWVETANIQNYTTENNLYTMLAAREAIKAARAGMYPTLYGTYSYQSAEGPQTFGPVGFSNVRNAITNMDINVDFPIFRGGYDQVNTRQAEYQFLSASDALELGHRNVTNLTRQAYFDVQSGIGRIKADKESIISTENQLEATKAGYTVGTRTMVDVLNSMTDVYNAYKTWANDRYTYVNSIVTLKQQAGILSPNDLAAINCWLGKSKNFDDQLEGITINKSVVSGFAMTPVEQTPVRPANYLNETTKLPLPQKVHTPLGPSIQPAPRSSVPPPGSSVPHTSVTSPQVLNNRHTVKDKNVEVSKARTAQLQSKPAPALSKKYYTIQLFSDRHKSSAENFIKKLALIENPQIQIASVKIKGQEWYRVYDGHFASEKAAASALLKLPSKIKAFSPLVKENA